MKKKRRIWIFAVVLSMAAVQGTAFAGTQETESSAEAITETIKADKILGTEALMKTAKEKTSDEQQEESEIKKCRTSQIKRNQKSVKKTANGQTLLDVSKGNITITSAGATGGGYKQ